MAAAALNSTAFLDLQIGYSLIFEDDPNDTQAPHTFALVYFRHSLQLVESNAVKQLSYYGVVW